MARPKKDNNKPSVRQKISTSFWKILAEGSYTDITIKRLALEAGVNHKSIYYHFKNIDAMAKELFYENAEEITSGAILGVNPFMVLFNNIYDFQKIVAENPEILAHVARARLYTRNDSAYLNSIFRTFIRTTWLNMLEIKEEDLSQNERADLNFIMAGIVAIIGQSELSDLAHWPQVYNRPLGQGILDTLKNIKKAHA